MSKAVKSKPKPKKPAAGKLPRGKIGRDLFALLVVGLGLGLSFVSTGVDPSKLRTLINNAASQVHELASDSPSNTSDPLAVSSIGDKTRIKQGAIRRYPVCSGSMARENCVVDGDTFYMDGVTIRVSDIDAPETHPPRCAHEADLGDRATTRLSQLLSTGPFQLVRHDRDLDKYGRQLRIVIRDGRSIGKVLVTEGLARPWTGKRRPWCGDSEDAAG